MTVEEQSDYWNSDEYLKRNAAGAHSGTHAIIAKLETLQDQLDSLSSEISEIQLKLDKIDRNCWALGFGILIVMWLSWKSA